MKVSIVFLLISLILCIKIAYSADSKKKTATKSSTKQKEREKVDGAEVEEFETQDKLAQHLKTLTDKTSLDETPSEEEMREFRKEELRTRLTEDDIIAQYGKVSLQYAQYLHRLGRSIYKQERYEDVFDISKEIVSIHEKIDGPEHENTARALGNLGSAAYRLEKWTICHDAMNRALYVWIAKYGEESKEVLLHRGKMLTFHVPFAKTTMGISYEDYMFSEL